MPVQPLWSVARIENVKVPAEVGVPERVPLEISVKPGGKLPLITAKEYGEVPPLAVIFVL